MFMCVLLFWVNYSLAMMSSADIIINQPRFNATSCDCCYKRHEKCVRNDNKFCNHCLKHNEICISRYIAYNHKDNLDKDMLMKISNYCNDNMTPKGGKIYRHKFWFEENIDNFLE